MTETKHTFTDGIRAFFNEHSTTTISFCHGESPFTHEGEMTLADVKKFASWWLTGVTSDSIPTDFMELGLCSNFLRWLANEGIENKTSDIANFGEVMSSNQFLKRMFWVSIGGNDPVIDERAFLEATNQIADVLFYPFGGEHQFDKDIDGMCMHENQMRIEWVKSILEA